MLHVCHFQKTCYKGKISIKTQRNITDRHKESFEWLYKLNKHIKLLASNTKLRRVISHNSLRPSDAYMYIRKNQTTIGSDNGLAPYRHQAIIWINAGILLIGFLGTNLSEILIESHTFSLKKMQLLMSSGKWRSFCLGINVLKQNNKLLIKKS